MSRDEQRGTHSSWWWGMAVAVMLLHPYLVVGVLGDPDGHRMAHAGHAVILLSDLMLLGAGVGLALDARLSYDGLRASMAVGATIVAVQDAPLVLLGILDPDLGAHSYRLTNGHLVTALIVLVVIHRGRQARAPGQHTVVVGVLLGLAALTTTLVLHALMTRWEHDSAFLATHDVPDIVLMAAIGTVLAAIGLDLRRSSLPAWASARIGVGLLAILAARLYATVIDAMTPPPVAVGGVAVFSALTATTAASLLRLSLEQADARVAHYARLAADAEAEVKQDREVAHEVRATAAGIAAAARLLGSGRLPPGPRRDALEAMVDSEAARLGRTVASRPDPLTTIAVDEIVAPLVVGQAARGHDVSWRPHGHRVIARHDALAEALGTLVNNAADHAGGRGTTITSSADGDHVEITVTDNGPGLDPSVRESLFTWGSHGTASGGQGIGLHRARRLLLEQGGTLDLVEETGPEHGAAFVIRLPRALDRTA